MVQNLQNSAIITTSSSQTPFLPKKGLTENRITWTDGAETRNRQIDYVAVSNGRRNWVANAQAKGVANSNGTLHHKTIKIDIKYDIIRTNKPLTINT